MPDVIVYPGDRAVQQHFESLLFLYDCLYIIL